jgi:glutamate dehydrogenase (NADP+)
MLKTKGEALEGQTAVISGFGNVAWGVATKLSQMGAKVVTLSGPDGFIYDPDGVRGEKIDYLLEMRRSNRDRVEDYADKFNIEFYPGKRPWEMNCDIAFPCACENELDETDAKKLLDNGCRCVTEVANMPVTEDGMNVLLQSDILYSPGKASNAAGVACSGLEMAQNSSKIRWTPEEVDQRLKTIMKNIHDNCLEAAEQFGDKGNYFFGANIAGFIKVANAMIDQGNT